MKITRDGKEYELTEDELLSAYREQGQSFRVRDAQSHCEGFNAAEKRHIAFTADDYESIADWFEETADCNVPENCAYDDIVQAYVSDNFNGDDTRKEN